MKKKLHWSKYHENYKNYILKALDSEDDLIDQNLSRKEKIEYLSDRFFDEYSFQINQLGQHGAMSEWLSGCAINIPFYYSDIIQLAKDMGSVDEDLTEEQEENICDNYFDFMASMALALINERVS
jgi:hypothetical protein